MSKTGKKQENTGRWKKGESGNPNGRPLKGHSITETIRSMFDEKPEIKKALSTKIIKLAIEDGDISAIRLLWNYIDGLPIAKQEITAEINRGVIILPEEKIHENKLETSSRPADQRSDKN